LKEILAYQGHVFLHLFTFKDCFAASSNVVSDAKDGKKLDSLVTGKLVEIAERSEVLFHCIVTLNIWKLTNTRIWQLLLGWLQGTKKNM
jgi:hypothetical protein